LTAALLAGVAGPALLDALNPATIAGVALLLLAPMAHPVRAAAGFAAASAASTNASARRRSSPGSVPIAAGYLAAAAGVLTIAVLA
jgi:hypothetical protein